MTVTVETTWSLTKKLGDLAVSLYKEHGLTIEAAYEQSWSQSWDPTGHLEAIEDVLFLMGAETLNTHCEDCAGLREDES